MSQIALRLEFGALGCFSFTGKNGLISFKTDGRFGEVFGGALDFCEGKSFRHFISWSMVAPGAESEVCFVRRGILGRRGDKNINYRIKNNKVLLSTCPHHIKSGCGIERRILIGPW